MGRFGFIYSIAILLLAAAVVFSYRNEHDLARIPLMKPLLAQREYARGQVKLNTLNLYMPRDYRPLFAAMHGDPDVRLDDFINYFRLIAQYMPGRPEAYAMAGFCYAHEGRLAEAKEALEKAIALDPGFFWSYYNFGLLLWRSGDAPQAKIVFMKSLSLPPQQTLAAIMSSKIYSDILTLNGQNHYEVPQSLLEGYRKVSSFLSIIDKSPAPVPVPWKFL